MSWRPEDHLPSDPTARPPDGDIAGECRFHAWGYRDDAGLVSPWGTGAGGYQYDCQGVTFMMAADEIDRLTALVADADAGLDRLLVPR